mgnify:CR=1 FL=1
MDNFVLLGIAILIVEAVVIVYGRVIERKLDKVIKLLSEEANDDHTN